VARRRKSDGQIGGRLTARASHPMGFSFPVPKFSRFFRRGLVWLLVMILVTFLTASVLHLEVPLPSGSYAVGRQGHVWVDTSRYELHTADPTDHRSVPVQLWYPAETGTGTAGPYVPNLAEIRDELGTSGDLSPIAVTALQWVRHDSLDDAAPATTGGHPVVIFSPGNQTNVIFYSAIAAELASHGYVVVGVDHPYQVAATVTAGGRIAGYDESWDLGPPGSMVAEKVAERVADIGFVLNSLRADHALLGGSLDLGRVAIVGHSNGGLAALEACRQMPDIDACVNLDGQGAGGPFSSDLATAVAPDQPYLFVTKEVALHPEIGSRFEAGGEGGYRVVIPAATHDGFTDGALFSPGINPLERETDHVMDAIRGFLLQFIGIEMEGQEPTVLGTVDTETDVFVNVYPLGENPPIPVTD
jgi:dienelactone hydrolase